MHLNKKYFSICIQLLLLFYSCIACSESLLLSANTELPIDQSLTSIAIKEGNQLHIEGVNNSASAAIVIIRIDNKQSKNYYSRYNKELTVLPGKFVFDLPLNGLLTSAKDKLTLPFTKLIIFDSSDKNITINKLTIEASPVAPDNVLALDFGEADSAIFPGFNKVTTASNYLAGKLRTKVRVSGDALIKDGIDGIDSIKTPWKNGTWKLSIWLADQGEWEYLAHFLSRKIVVNNNVFISQVFDWQQWVKQIYFAGGHKEAIIDGDLWEVIGKRRNGMITKTIEIDNNQLDIKLLGVAEAKFVSALVLEPVDSNFAEQTEDLCRQKFLAKWPVKVVNYTQQSQASITDTSKITKIDGSYIAAKDTVLNLCFEIDGIDDDNPFVHVAAPQDANGNTLTPVVRYAHWRYERPYPNASVLVASDSYLRTDIATMRLSKKVPRKLYTQVYIPADAQHGLYNANLQLVAGSKLYSKDFSIRVLNFKLPKLSQSVGLYLEPPPYYHWFNMQQQVQDLFVNDLSFLAQLGFTTVAPALPTPNSKLNILDFKNMVQQQVDHGFNDIILAYAPLKRLLTTANEQEAASYLLSLHEILGEELFSKVYWSVFDEPHTTKIQQITNNINWLSQLPIEIKTAGHANNSKQNKLLTKVDLLLINHGLQLNKKRISKLTKQTEVWLYNMENPRIAAGFYLWKQQLSGYLQWHAQMPTADPFDPTDGREGDLMYLYPPELSNGEYRNIHRRLLDIHEATLDLRWLNWLQKQAKANDETEKLLKNINKIIPDNWSSAKKIATDKLQEMRSQIISTLTQ